MSKVRIYGDTSGYIDVAAPTTADNSTLDLSTVAKTTELPTLSSLGIANHDDINVDSSGRVTMPNQPLVVVSNSATSAGVVTGGTLVIDRTSMYDGTNGRFTCPVSGAYFCSIVVYAGTTTDTFEIFVQKNGADYGGLFQKNYTGGNFEGQSGSVIVNASAGDYIEFRNLKGSIRGGTNDKRCVYLLS